MGLRATSVTALEVTSGKASRQDVVGATNRRPGAAPRTALRRPRRLVAPAAASPAAALADAHESSPLTVLPVALQAPEPGPERSIPRLRLPSGTLAG